MELNTILKPSMPFKAPENSKKVVMIVGQGKSTQKINFLALKTICTRTEYILC